MGTPSQTHKIIKSLTLWQKELEIIQNSLSLSKTSLSILNDINEFVHSIVQIHGYSSPNTYLYSGDEDFLKGTPYEKKGPFYSSVSKSIFISYYIEKLKIENLKNTGKIITLAHEVAHYIQDTQMNINKLILPQIEKEIIAESHADYFSGWFFKYCIQLGILTSNDIKMAKGFIYLLTSKTTNDAYKLIEKININKGSFILINGDTHGPAKHRILQFTQGLQQGNKKYFHDLINFQPKCIIPLDIKIKKS